MLCKVFQIGYPYPYLVPA